MSKRKQHAPKFKKKVALEALMGEETVLPGLTLDRGEMHDPHSDPGYEGWRKQALSLFDLELNKMNQAQRDALFP